MRIKRIKLKNFRNYDTLETELAPGINLFFGQNGSGKTNLLEAVHYCALGKSHRTSQDREVIRRDCDMGACGVTLEKRDGTHDVAVKLLSQGEKRKQIFLDGKKASRIANMMGTLQCVIFSPEDLMLVKEGPAIRRKFLDMLLSQLSTSYFTSLQNYQQALQQRNALLRNWKNVNHAGKIETMELWEEAMAKAAEVIVPARQTCCDRLAKEARERYAAISGKEKEIFQIAYQSCIQDTTKIREQMISQWKNRREDDLRRGSTSFGLHRDDLLLTIQGKEMKLFASQGQIRTAALAMKLSELTVFRELAGEYPILLLDDVMSELDVTRRRRLLDEIRGIQTLITCTDESDLGQQEKYVPWKVQTDSEGTAHVMECAIEQRRERISKLDDSFLE